LSAPYDASARPAGYIPLCVAENNLVGDLLLPELEKKRALPESVLAYDHMTGSVAFREKLARFFAERVFGRTFATNQIAVLAGAGCVLEILFHAIADPGDGVLVPTPSYAGFWPDLETRDELRIIPVHGSPGDGARLTAERLDRALSEADCPVRALLLTSPDNPTGYVYSAAELHEVISWCLARDLHLVMDEIYALSVFGSQPFVSAATLVPSLGDSIHLVWAFSKDFAASGLRAGVLVSENQDVLTVVDGLAYWACCSGHTQFVLGEMISDETFVNRYVGEMQARLGKSYRAVCDALSTHGIEYFRSDAGFFLLLDLRRFLKTASWEAEHELWLFLLARTNVSLTPGSACRIAEPGFMRLCFAAVPLEVAVVGVEKIGRALADRQ